MFEFVHILEAKYSISENHLGFSCIFHKHLGVSSVMSNWCWDSWSRPLRPEKMKKGALEFPENETEDLVVKNE